MPLTVRPARAEDRDAIADLLGQLGYPASPDAVPPRLERMQIVGDHVAVAEVDGAVVGLAALQVSPTLEDDLPAAKLAVLVVDQRHRRSGVGRSLVEAVEAEARRRGCGVFFLTTAERRGGAHSFYRRIGLEETGRRFAKRLA